VECLNGYRLKERLPANMGNFKTPIGVVETVKDGSDITLVSYGSTLRLVEEAAKQLTTVGIDAEVIDIQSLVPFDIHHDIVKSITKTNRIVVIDEDVPGGASAYIMDKILNEQDAFEFLDSAPKTMSANAHRPAYGNDGDYFSKPSTEDIFEFVYDVMHELSPIDFPKLR
jgi:pyruvate/2-oxoglutarate/acetoin dehydrogenase E1 component